MGNCAGEWPDNLLVSNTIIEDIKKLEPEKLFYYFDQWSELKSLKHTSQFLYKIENRYKQIQNKCLQGIKEMLEKSNRNKLDYKQTMYFHTNQMQMLVKACTEQRQMLINFHKNIKNQMQKKKVQLKSYGEKIKEIKQKSKKIKSQITNNSIDASLQRKLEQQKQIQEKKMQIQKQVSCYEQKIKRSFAVDSSQINQQEREGIISTQIQNIKVRYEEEIQSLNTHIFELKDNIKKIKKQSNEALSFLNAEKQEKLKKKQQIINMKNNQIQNLGFKIDQLNMKIDQLNMKINELVSESTNMQQSQKKARRSSQIFNLFINSKVIYGQYRKGKKNKEILIQIFKPFDIKKSKLIFAYDKIKPNNMFQYIDNQQNLVFLGQMENGTIIGGFSKQGFKQDMHKMNKNLCFIFSIHSEQQYNKLDLKGEGMAMHSVKLDKNYLRFGSNEIRVTCGSNKGYSVINSSASIFSPKQSNIICDLQQFLGQKQQKYELKNCQVFELQISDIQIPIKQQERLLFSAIDH